ncbi:SusC/RagA family TonB-linked outer membrane protein [Chryseobacterium fluminis]|uniref:SusC/RagA family TonB-linked outer membrane protein n=1 Tax=Chryseobacterium fluminis TaxID=2983606 RepID=UPI00225A2D0E|nr:SusC/RagA family TonB-linked outer membrane protein [Chryseobacterium sp. MMS21-Ot14]UZT98099.1 SusC/RagA family TonB-linked outer membrane protein [Chryseobacterium sp. MMS21-Ot14]
MKKFAASILMVCGAVGIHAQTSSGKKDSLEVQSIEEVVITSSYGTKKLKEEVVGSMVTLTDKDISASQPFESIDKMIAGLAPGVQIVNNTELGKPVSINIRGLGSLAPLNGRLGTSTQPLIVVDGVIMREDNPFDVAGFDGASTAEVNINPLARFNSDNIESISILKDAAAVALYGAESANGVILITTKKGKKGKPQFSLMSQYGISQSINKIKYLSGQQYARLYKDFQNNNKPGSGTDWNGVDVDWFELMNGNGDFFRTNFTASGGGKYLTYRVGLDYSNNNESKIMNSLEKKEIDASVGFNNKKWQINLYAAYNNFSKIQPNTYFNFILAPDRAAYDENGNYALSGNNGIPNPLAAANQNRVNVKNNSLISSLNVSYEIIKGLKISSLFGADLSKKENIDFRSGLNQSGIANNILGRSRLNASDGQKWNWSSHLMYEKNFGEKHHLDALIGMELRQNKDFKESESGTNFENYAEYQQPWRGSNYTYKSLTLQDNGRSFFSQLNYDYHKKYFLSGSIRRDESSAFGPDTNAAVNGGIGASWLISQENFLKKNSVLSFLRLRASWGITGNSRIGSYRSSGIYTYFQSGFTYDFDYAYPESSSPPNRMLSWEKNEKLNLGLDFALFKKLEFTIEAYRNTVSDMIVSREVPVETGYGSAEINGAAMYNQGIEISMRGNWMTKPNFKWITSFNISTVKNKVTDLLGLEDKFSTAAIARAQKIGAPTSAIWGYQWLGINAENGQDIFMVNDVPTDANQFTANASTYTIIGDSQPKAIGGLSNSIRYKNLSLSFLINFELGGDVLVAGELIDQYNILSNRNMSVNALDYWTGTGDASAVNHIPKSNAKIIANSTKHLYDNTHVKLQNINLNYQLPLHKIKNSFVKSASIFADCTNVLYWYKEKSPAGRNGIREFRYLYPEMRTFSFGFKFNF